MYTNQSFQEHFSCWWNGTAHSLPCTRELYLICTAERSLHLPAHRRSQPD